MPNRVLPPVLRSAIEGIIIHNIVVDAAQSKALTRRGIDSLRNQGRIRIRWFQFGVVPIVLIVAMWRRGGWTR